MRKSISVEIKGIYNDRQMKLPVVGMQLRYWTSSEMCNEVKWICNEVKMGIRKEQMKDGGWIRKEVEDARA